MKNLFLILILFLVIGCSSEEEIKKCTASKITYIVHYPGGPVTKTYKGKLCSYSESSSQGSNSLKVTEYFVDEDGDIEGPNRYWIEDTTAPIQVVSFE